MAVAAVSVSMPVDRNNSLTGTLWKIYEDY